MIKNGTILVAGSTAIPDGMETGDEVYAGSWKVVQNVEGYGLDRDMHKIGWSFLHSAPQIKVAALGFGRQNAVGGAIRRLLTRLKNNKFNCLEIRSLAAKNILGITYITIAAHPMSLSLQR
jgi:hypothetical protein